MKKKFEIEKYELIEKLGVFFEKEEHWAPFAARILAMITLSGKKGVTFEELVKRLHAGKSTVSSHLDALQTKKRVAFYTQEGDRKRHFIVDENLIFTFLSRLEEEWKERKYMYESVKQFQEKCLAFGEVEKNNFDITFLDNFLEYTEEVIQSINKLQSKIEK